MYKNKTMLETFIEKVSFPLLARYEGRKNLHGLYRSMVKNQYSDRPKIMEMQNRKLKWLLNGAYNSSKYYRRRFNESGFNPQNYKDTRDLQNVPILTKKDIRENREEIINFKKCPPARFKKDMCSTELIHSVSGGTTGPSIDVFNDRLSMTEKIAAQLRFNFWPGWKIGEWYGLIWPAVVDHAQRKEGLKGKLKNYMGYRSIFLQQSVIDEKDFQNFFNQFKARKATVIRGFPFQITEAANYCKTYGLHFRHLKGIITTGEPLYSNQRDLIENTFGCRVFDSYRTREVGCVAQECEEHDGYHISAETVYVESVENEQDNNGKMNEDGKILITDLTNLAAPIIRYEIGDVGIVSDQNCRCGRGLPLIKKIGGRITDLMYTPDGKKVSPVTVIPNLFHLVGIMNQFQIVQDRYDHIQIKMVKPLPESTLIDKQRENIKKIFGPAMRVSYKAVDKIESLSSGKYSFVVSDIGNDKIKH